MQFQTLLSKSLLVISGVFLFQTARCQQNYQSAYIVQRGDTITGFIDYRNWRGNPDVINFRKSMDEAETPLSLARCIPAMKALRAAPVRI